MRLLDTIKSCNTGQIEGLSKQLISRLLAKNVLVKIEHPLIKCEGRHNNPYLQREAYLALLAAVKHRNKILIINSCLRTVMQQYVLRLQYENNLCGIRAAAYPGQSNHQSGMAIDIMDWQGWKPYLEKQNWKWLGYWDKWHFDFKGQGVRLGYFQIMEFQRLWNQYNPDDLIKADGVWGPITARKCSRCPPEGFGRGLVLKKGDYSRQVGEMQQKLRSALGWGIDRLKADCHFGSATFKAVCIYQKKHNLPITGTVNNEMIQMLKNAPKAI